ncbi:MAG: fibronectin/fibrinogen-binding protein [Clostridiaceae bacterium]|nr:fibronectin/fibrinogen-binding protein [Clostridiaceae bacterium]
MPYDGIVANAAVWELSGLLIGGRIEKVYQAERDEITLLIHSMGERFRLLASANATYPRLHLTTEKKENPMNPPPFCMVLRKHLQGGRIVNITQSGYDRIITLSIEKPDEMGDLSTKHLIVEIMGRHSNIILVNDSKTIIDSIKHVDANISSVREVLPLRPYELPPQQEKQNPESIDFEKLFNENPAQRLDKHLVNCVWGFSPFLSVAICNKADVDPFKNTTHLTDGEKHRLKETLSEVADSIRNRNYAPAIIHGDKVDFHVLSAAHAEKNTLFSTVNLMLDEFYTKKDMDERLNAVRANILKSVNTAIERNMKKLAIHEETIREAAEFDKYRVYGELLFANIYNLKEGKYAEVFNYYEDPPILVKIELDEEKSIKTNANRYFNRYKKLKSSYENALNLLDEVKDELFYLENVKTHLENASDFETLEDIRQELYEGGYVKIQSKGRKSKKAETKSKPIHVVSEEGYDIYIGRNNKQNEELSLRFASQNDLWLHVKDAPGSHVIVRTGAKNGVVTQKVIEEAASYAAFYSSHRTSTNVVVDFTRVKHVRKIPKSKPGMVSYTNHKSIVVKPREASSQS